MIIFQDKPRYKREKKISLFPHLIKMIHRLDCLPARGILKGRVCGG